VAFRNLFDIFDAGEVTLFWIDGTDLLLRPLNELPEGMTIEVVGGVIQLRGLAENVAGAEGTRVAGIVVQLPAGTVPANTLARATFANASIPRMSAASTNFAALVGERIAGGIGDSYVYYDFNTVISVVGDTDFTPNPAEFTVNGEHEEFEGLQFIYHELGT